MRIMAKRDEDLARACSPGVDKIAAHLSSLHLTVTTSFQRRLPKQIDLQAASPLFATVWEPQHR